MRHDEDALVCDLAETYHVYDWRSLPVRTVASLATGLHTDSRIKRAFSGMPCSMDTLLNAVIADRLGLLVWMKTKDAEKGRNRPKSIVEMLLNKEQPTEKAFDSVEAFEAARAALLGE